MTITFTTTTEQLRLLAKRYRKDAEFTTADAEAFLQLFHVDLTKVLQNALDNFLESKLR